ncbi:cytochrome bd-I oxidase subunit CydX [Pararobbsia silviterrae]|uniref:Cytochrome bd-I oxidase subunit CydX n=1 Tax=Pararobbsia silviterrae TaxID=1792498 RepID=A0A494Y805_9BURK|nr:cytochrome bd-I oxidase subunit CydX [Pararobbsia silviterrae]
MWYFSWILGIGVALAAGVISALWFESHDARDISHRPRAKPTGHTHRAASAP